MASKSHLPQPAHGCHIATRRPLTRRRFLRGAGIALSLPFLEAMLPGFAWAAGRSGDAASRIVPRRMLGICNNLGVLGENFFPTASDRPARRLSPRRAHRLPLTLQC